MARRLPSLNALKAFEASARHGAFTAAAEELFVTHAAVSRHIRDLEEWLGTELFTRTGRGVALTDAGRRYGEQLTPLFDALANATREAAAQGSVRRLMVTVEPSIASRWLVPRLGRFNELHPDIELVIDPSSRLVNFRAGEADVGIRFGKGDWDDVEAFKLAESASFPVCAPSLIKDYAKLTLADLKDFTLLHEDRKQWWTDWLVGAGADPELGRRGPIFQAHLAIEAAEAGQGFALADQALSADAIAEGWLVEPFAHEMKSEWKYWVVRAKGQKESSPVRSFREWLMGEMAETLKKFTAMKAKTR